MPLFPYVSRVSSFQWPAIVPMQSRDLAALLLQLEQSQWAAPEDVQRGQLRQLAILLAFARAHSAFQGERLSAFDMARPWTYERFMDLPLMWRADLQLPAREIDCKAVPSDAAPVHEAQSSGSTGQPVAVRRTGFNMLMWSAMVLRDHLWHQRDFSQSMATVRFISEPLDRNQDAGANGWGTPVSLLFESGPLYAQPLSMLISDQAQWLLRRNPRYLLTHPSNAQALLDEFGRLRQFPGNLRELRTMGETVSHELRQRCRDEFGVKMTDVYSSAEVGYIALECPVSGLYHFQSEGLIVELLNTRGVECAAGEVGRVVVTDLHNFATPMIRYDIGDYAEAGPPCPCGRGLRTATRILGRRRNMVRLPAGGTHWAQIGYQEYRRVAPVKQFQFVQRNLHEIEARLVVSQALDTVQENKLREIILRNLGYPFRLHFKYFNEPLAHTTGGKFEEFVSEVED